MPFFFRGCIFERIFFPLFCLPIPEYDCFILEENFEKGSVICFSVKKNKFLKVLPRSLSNREREREKENHEFSRLTFQKEDKSALGYIQARSAVEKKMFSRGKWKNETEINVTLDEPLTNESYTKVVVELIKYVLYQKQQIPCAYDALAQLHTRTKATDKNAIFFKTLSNTLENVSDNLSSQFYIDGCDIKEVAILLGATVLSPKLYIGIELPSCVLDSKQHMEYQHPSRKTLLKLMRSVYKAESYSSKVVRKFVIR